MCLNANTVSKGDDMKMDKSRMMVLGGSDRLTLHEAILPFKCGKDDSTSCLSACCYVQWMFAILKQQQFSS